MGFSYFSIAEIHAQGIFFVLKPVKKLFYESDIYFFTGCFNGCAYFVCAA